MPKRLIYNNMVKYTRNPYRRQNNRNVIDVIDSYQSITLTITLTF